MTRKRLVVAVAVLSVFAGVVLLGYHYRGLLQVQAFNGALLRDDLQSASNHPSQYGKLARAVLEQRDADYQHALALYAELKKDPGSPLSETVLYNIGTLYLSWGIASRLAGREELALPLFELAKETLRTLLQRNSDWWAARYNLQQALVLSPDGADLDPNPQGMPEHSPQALGNIDSHQQLP